jgi:DNA-binding HxlR family transcriptional regulator
VRSYRDLCGIARALDVVGERWALLVVRELIFGPKRFADLHRGLPGMSQNVLTQRLRELEEAGVLTRRHALPPTNGLVYDLTDRGRELEPVLLALGRWGSPTPPGPNSATELSADALIVALRTTFNPQETAGLDATVRLELPNDAFLLTVRDGALTAARGDGAADVSLAGSVRTIQDLVFEGSSLDAAIHSGEAHTTGDITLLKHFLVSFDDQRRGTKATAQKLSDDAA